MDEQMERQKTSETRKIYEELLNEITEAMQKMKSSSTPTKPTVPKLNKPIVKLGSIPIQGLSPRILKAIGQSANAAKLGLSKPKPNIVIYHQPLTHLNDHPINQAIAKINYIIKLIFKQGKDQLISKDVVLNAGAQHQLEEAKLSEIHRMAKMFSI